MVRKEEREKARDKGWGGGEREGKREEAIADGRLADRDGEGGEGDKKD